MVHSGKIFQSFAVIVDQFPKRWKTNAPLGGQPIESEAAAVNFVTEQFAKTSSTAGWVILVLILDRLAKFLDV